MSEVESIKSKRVYVLNKAMKRRYPDGDFKVVGEIEKNKEISENLGVQIKLSNGEMLSVKHTGFYKKSKYHIHGYIKTEKEDEYVAVVENVAWKYWLISSALILLIAIGGYFLWQNSQGPDIDPDLKDYVSDLKRPEGLDKTRILVPSYPEFLMNADTDVLSANLFNPDDNPCYFQYKIELNDGTVLYESKLIPPGKAIQDPKLNQKMPQGSYKIIVRVKSYDLNDYKTEFNGAEIPTTLKALK